MSVFVSVFITALKTCNLSVSSMLTTLPIFSIFFLASIGFATLFLCLFNIGPSSLLLGILIDEVCLPEMFIGLS